MSAAETGKGGLEGSHPHGREEMGGNGFIRPKAGSTSWLSHLSSEQEIRDSAFLTAETQVSAACAISVQAELKFTFVSCHHT